MHWLAIAVMTAAMMPDRPQPAHRRVRRMAGQRTGDLSAAYTLNWRVQDFVKTAP